MNYYNNLMHMFIFTIKEFHPVKQNKLSHSLIGAGFDYVCITFYLDSTRMLTKPNLFTRGRSQVRLACND